MKTILSLFDYSGNWPSPYYDHGFKVIQIDTKLGNDVMHLDEWTLDNFGPIYGILAAPPCTDFALSGAQYWKKKDANGTTEESLRLVKKTLEIVAHCKPHFWALENPVGRLPKLLPEIGSPWYFQPHWFGDPYTKKTGLWGDFSKDLVRTDVEPIRATKQGSWLQKLGGKSERTKELRSMTPMGFAKAFFYANH